MTRVKDGQRGKEEEEGEVVEAENAIQHDTKMFSKKKKGRKECHVENCNSGELTVVDY